MTRLTRRRFGAAAGAAALAGIAAPSIAAAAARLVVVGGGPAGATVARYLAHASSRAQVTLVEAEPRYHTCFFGNLYLSGLRSFDSLGHGYDALKAKHGVAIVHDQGRGHRSGSQTGAVGGGRQLGVRQAGRRAGDRVPLECDRGAR